MTITGSPARPLVALVLAAVLAAGCGGEATPADAAPELAEQLTRVDRAVAAGNDAQIREQVESLAAATEAARESGRLDDEQADRILAAADALLQRLPADEPTTRSPSPRPSPTTTTTPPSPEGEEGKPDKHGKEEKEEKDEPGKGRHHQGEGHEDDEDDDD